MSESPLSLKKLPGILLEPGKLPGYYKSWGFHWSIGVFAILVRLDLYCYYV